VKEKGIQQPFLIPIGERAAKIAEAFSDRQRTTEGALQELTSSVNEAQEAQERFETSGLSMEGFAAFWFLRGRGVDRAEEIGRQMGDAFARHPYWHSDAKQAQQVRIDLYKALVTGGAASGSRELVDDVLSTLRRAAP
jgi:type I restriction enzyme R subunit